MPPPAIDLTKPLRLHKNCIFVQLRKSEHDEPRAVVLRHEKNPNFPTQHYTPLNDAACMVLDLLAHNCKPGQGEGITFDNIVDHILLRYATNKAQAEYDLTKFLKELEEFELIQNVGQAIPVDDRFYKDNPTPDQSSQGHVVAGGTLICCGPVINWNRP